MGKHAQGRHPKLIDKGLFDRVQTRLDTQARLIYDKDRGKGGIYEYFSCVRQPRP